MRDGVCKKSVNRKFSWYCSCSHYARSNLGLITLMQRMLLIKLQYSFLFPVIIFFKKNKFQKIKSENIKLHKKANK